MQVRSHLRKPFALCDLFANLFHLRGLRVVAPLLRTADKPVRRCVRLSLRLFLTSSHFRRK
jgi:hypothetical protein